MVQLIDQRFLPHRFVIEEIRTVQQMAEAIREMHVRGAGLIGASAGYGMYLAAVEAAANVTAGEFDDHLARAAAQLRTTRPTAINLSWATDRQLKTIAKGKTAKEKVALALRTANLTVTCSRIAMPDGSRSSIMVPRQRRFMPRTTVACRSMYGWLRPDPEIRDQNLRPGS